MAIFMVHAFELVLAKDNVVFGRRSKKCRMNARKLKQTIHTFIYALHLSLPAVLYILRN
jgi:hypothetical protein